MATETTKGGNTMNLDAFRYSTILALTRNGINTIEELDRLTNEQIASMRGIGARSYKEILERLGRDDTKRRNEVTE
jgi:DNA-directed RNA polymerase alpha subunit